jgi:hypothetical protein
VGIKTPEVEVDAKECVKSLQCKIKIKGWKRFSLRTRIAFSILKLFARIMPIETTIEIQRED